MFYERFIGLYVTVGVKCDACHAYLCSVPGLLKPAHMLSGSEKDAADTKLRDAAKAGLLTPGRAALVAHEAGWISRALRGETFHFCPKCIQSMQSANAEQPQPVETTEESAKTQS